MVVSSKCVGPRPKMPVERACFTFLGQSAAEHQMTAEDELEQPSGSSRSSTLALRKTLSWTSVTPSCMSLDAWLAASGATSEVVWRQFDLAGRRLWLSCSEPAAVRRKSRRVHRRAWRYSSPIWKRWYCKPLSQPSCQLAECTHDAGRVCASCHTFAACCVVGCCYRGSEKFWTPEKMSKSWTSGESNQRQPANIGLLWKCLLTWLIISLYMCPHRAVYTLCVYILCVCLFLSVCM